MLALAAALSACGDACSDETKKSGDDEPTCQVGEVYNPVTGTCQPSMTGGPASDGGLDAGGGDGDGGTSPEPDAGEDPMDIGADLSSSCEGNERRCNANAVELCVDGMFTTQQTCGMGMVCNRGNCVPEDSGACEPGATRCAGQSGFQTCQADGMTWGGDTACSEGTACVDGQCVSGCAGFINEKSNVGCDYITMRHDQASGLQVLPHTVVVSNPGDQPVTVDVSSPGGLNAGIAQQTVAPLSSAVLNFPTSPMVSNPGVSANLYLIKSSRPVIATQFAPLNNPGLGSETSDASLLLPTNAVGKEYVVVGWRSLQPAGTYVDIVATRPNTVVTVQSPIPLSGGAAGSVAENSSTMFTIPENQVLHLAENRGFFDSGTRDVSGVVITASEPVAVFTGATIVNIPDEPIETSPPAGCTAVSQSCVLNTDCCSGLCGYNVQTRTYGCVEGFQAGDHIEQQLFPVESWGTSYVAAPFNNRGSNDFVMYRLVAATDATSVTLDPPVDGVSSFTLNRGEYRQIVSPDAFELTATNPVMLAQFMIGGQSSASGDGDPAFMIPPAEQQFRDSYVFLVPANYDNNYVTLIKKTGTQVTLDGAPVAQSEFVAVGGTSMWEYAIINGVTQGVHRANSTERFGVIVHGMDEYISYAFAGGIILPE